MHMNSFKPKIKEITLAHTPMISTSVNKFEHKGALESPNAYAIYGSTKSRIARIVEHGVVSGWDCKSNIHLQDCSVFKGMRFFMESNEPFGERPSEPNKVRALVAATAGALSFAEISFLDLLRSNKGADGYGIAVLELTRSQWRNFCIHDPELDDEGIYHSFVIPRVMADRAQLRVLGGIVLDQVSINAVKKNTPAQIPDDFFISSIIKWGMNEKLGFQFAEEIVRIFSETR